jgi:diguanylate cyclase (GGDEF)-like protein
MQESLYDRFRPFKPYDLVLSLSMLVLVTPASHLGAVSGALTVIGGMVVFFLLDAAQRFVRVPTPRWQIAAIVGANTAVVALLLHLHDAYDFSLAFAMLNTAFATVAFGQLAGMTTAGLSVLVLSQLCSFSDRIQPPAAQWMLYLVVLFSFVAILVRVNRMQQDALHDMVTNLRNHRYFQARLREELQRSERQGNSMALLVLDLDDFKHINDRHGHAVGDEVLAGVAQALVRNARGIDVVCRYGGEEMAVILPQTSVPDALSVADRLRQAVMKRPDPRGIQVTVSIGVAVYPHHATTANDLIQCADAAMYLAKKAGKNRVEAAQAEQRA